MVKSQWKLYIFSTENQSTTAESPNKEEQIKEFFLLFRMKELFKEGFCYFIKVVKVR